MSYPDGARPPAGFLPAGMKSRCVSSAPASHAGEPYEVLDLRLEGSCGSEVAAGCCCGGMTGGDRRQVAVYRNSDVPQFLHHSPFVLYGYRATLPFSLCIRSLFAWSNDTVNIWSHLVGFFLFVFVLLWDNAVLIPDTGFPLLDRLVLSAGLVCFQFCMLCSAGYHLFRCHSERAHLRWLALDLTGISVGLLGCYLPAIHFGFYCLSVWRDVYLIVIGCLFAAVFYWQTKPRYYSPRWFKLRLLLYVGLSGYGVVPALHWVYLNGGLGAPIVQEFVPKICVVYLLAGLAFAFYVSQFPERCFPGRFDYIGSSHQCWHVVVVLVFLWWHRAGRDLLLYRATHPCEADRAS